MIRRRHVSLILAGCLALFVARAAWAGPPTDQLKAFLHGVTKSLENPALTGDGKVKERRAAVRRMADDIFDLERSYFSKIVNKAIRTSSYSELVKKLKSKQEEFSRN